ncbi:MAG: hypothetical protein J6D28_00100 [Bacilli bacterium]|nr:hypothetical protein [Bacilli bacterium]
MKNLSSILWGFVLVIVGVILALNAFEITDISIFFDGWWTLFIIVPCFIGLFDNNDGKTGNVIGIVIGTLLLLSCRGIMDFNVIWKLILPSILVIIGLSFIFKNAISSSVNNKIKEINKKNNNKENKEYISTFSGQKLDFRKEEFTGCRAQAIFGGMGLDLTDAIIKEDVVINASSIFGGIDIKAPADVNVKVNSTSIFGGVENKVKNKDSNKFTIYVNANCLFGGVEIK